MICGRTYIIWVHRSFSLFKNRKKRQEFRLTESDGNCWGESEKGKLDFTQQYAMDPHDTFCR